MSVSQEMQLERRELRNYLQDIVEDQPEPAMLPIVLARAMHASGVDVNRQRAGLDIVRNWVDYASECQVQSDNPFAIRHHISRFAAQELGEQRSYETLQEVDITGLQSNGLSYVEALSRQVSPSILADPDVALIGGAARLALKMHAGVDVRAELPISDVDAVMTSKTKDVAQKAAEYTIDLSGAKIVDGDVRSALDSLATNFDCTMNQAAVYDGRLFFSERALRDVKDGAIRLVAKNDPLFGSEGVRLADGNVYVNRVGFYRGLSFLLRGKGDHLVVSQENIEREKDAIGRYWQIMLLVKLLPMKDEVARAQAIGQWHQIAYDMGSTETSNAEEFLDELAEAYPNSRGGNKQVFDANAQARWIINKLVNQAVLSLYEQEEFTPPATYTEAALSRPVTFAEYDYAAFMNKATSAGN